MKEVKLLLVIFTENKLIIDYEQRGRGKWNKKKAIKNCVNFIRRFHCKGNVFAENVKAILGTLEFREAHLWLPVF